jgi:hypothetical protein
MKGSAQGCFGCRPHAVQLPDLGFGHLSQLIQPPPRARKAAQGGEFGAERTEAGSRAGVHAGG